MALADLGIDPRVAELLEADGIKELYPPQVDAWDAIKGGQNVVAAIPTASGKSLIAYLAILHRWLATGKKALYIVPLRALASEKHRELQEFKSLGIKVAVSTGDLDDAQARRLAAADVIVCTSEKADALLRHRTAWVSDIGCVVADEFHLINDTSRGPTLEVILARFNTILPDAQLVGLSATVANSRQLATWLGAQLVESTWRPVDLRMGTYFGNSLQFLGQEATELPAAGEPITSLAEQTIKDGGQVLVFVSTRRSAEAQAQKLAGPIRELLTDDAKEELAQLVKELGGDEASATAQKLAKLASAGVAYHTAALDAGQRRFIEDQFRAGKIKVLCATPTLAAGVNTPARRVIIRDLRRFEMGYGNRPLPVMEVQQMMGRAGRPRFDPWGEAVLMVKSIEEKEGVEHEYLRGDPEPVTSKLAADAALRIHTLASVAGGYCDSKESLLEWLQGTFWAQETDDWILRDRLDDTLWFMEENGFLEEDGDRIKPTNFGRRTSDLYIDPLSALRLRQALESSVPITEFGILEAISGCPNVYALYLRKNDDWVQQRFWDVHESLLVEEDGRDIEAALSYAKTAFLLQDWMAERPMQELENRYQVGPGDIRMRVENAGWLLHATRELARSFNPDAANFVTELGMRLEHGVRKELLPLLRLKGVGRIRARTLANAGFPTPSALQKATIDRIAGLPGFGKDSAQALLKQVGANANQETVVEVAPEVDSQKGQVDLREWS